MALQLAFCGFIDAVAISEGTNFSTGFNFDEGYSPGYLQTDSVWSVEGDYPLIGPFGMFGGYAADLFPDSQLSLDLSSLSQKSIGWVDFYLKPAFDSIDNLPTSFSLGQVAVTGFVKLGPYGEIFVLNGDGAGNGLWMSTGYYVLLDADVASDWLRMTYRLDYSTQRWDLYLNDTLQMIDIGFVDANAPPLSGFTLEGSTQGQTLFDEFEAGFINPLFTDVDNDGIEDAYELSEGLNTTFNDRNLDKDNDNIQNVFEFMNGLSAGNPDSDNDGVSDSAEINAGANPLEADVYNLSEVPYVLDFEAYNVGSLVGNGNWLIQGGVASIQLDEAYSGMQALSIEAGDTVLDVTNAFDGSDASVVWFDFYLKPIRFSSSGALDDIIDSSTSSIFYFKGEDALVVFDGNGSGGGSWETLTLPFVGNQSWERIVLRKDYASQSYAVWVNGALVADNVGFAWKQPYFSQLRFFQEADGSAFLDDLTIGVTKPIQLDSDVDGIFDEIEDGNGNGVVDTGETDPLVADTDGDGIIDGASVKLRLWLRADLGLQVDIDGKVSSWEDQSIYRNDAVQVNALLRPEVVVDSFNGLPAIHFDGVDDYLEGAASFNPSAVDYTMFVVHRKTGGHEKSAPFSYSTTTTSYGAPLLRWGPEANNLGINEVGFGADGVYLNLGEDHAEKLYIASVSRSGGSNGLNADLTVRALAHNEGVAASGVQNWTSGDATGYFVGKKKVSNDHMFGGEVIEILVYEGVLDEVQRGIVEQQLGVRYGLGLDRDLDGLPDAWEMETFGSFEFTAADDPDGDGVINLREYNLGTDANAPDEFASIQGDSDLRLWLSAELGAEVDASGNVERLLDLSGWGDHATQTDAAKRPALISAGYGGQATIQMDGVDDFLIGDSHFNASAGDFTFIAIVRQASGNGLSASLSYSSSDTALGAPLLRWNRPNSGDLGINDVGASVDGSFVSLAESVEAFQLVSITRSGGDAYGQGATLKVRALSDGHTLESNELQTWISGASNGYFLGKKKTTSDGNNDLLKGEIAEVLVFDSALTAERLKEIEESLGSKYGMALDVDADGLLDAVEYNYFGSLNETLEGDFDKDGLSNARELVLGMNPAVLDELGPVLGNESLAVWLKSDEGLVEDSSGRVQSWEDRSGYARKVEQATASAQPVLVTNAISGFPAVQLDGTDDYLLGNAGFSPDSGEFTLFVVHRRTGGHDKAATLSFNQPSGATGAPLLRWGPNVGQIGVNNVGVNADGVYADLGQSATNEFIVTSVSRSISKDETANPILKLVNEGYSGVYEGEGEQTWTGSESSIFALGRKAANSSHFFGGDIAEVIIFQTELPYDQFKEVHEYLVSKYGVNSDLDNDGLLNTEEDLNSNGVVDAGETDPLDEDTDDDGIPDSLSVTWIANPATDASALQIQQDGFKSLKFSFEESEGYFAGQLGGQQGWEASRIITVYNAHGSEGAVRSLLSKAHPYEEQYAHAKHYLSAEGEPIVWVSFKARMKPIDLLDPELIDPTAGAVFGMSTSKSVAAYDIAAREWLTASVAIEPDAWVQYDVQLDYTAKVWKLCVNGVAVFESVPFVDPTRESLSSFALLQQSAESGLSWIDEIVISNFEPEGLDFDNDGLMNSLERELGSNPSLSDSDGDGMTDSWEYDNGLDLLLDDSSGDLDGDRLTNIEEFQFQTDTQFVDTYLVSDYSMPEVWFTSSERLIPSPENDFASLGEFTFEPINVPTGAKAYASAVEEGRYFLEGAGLGPRNGGDSGQFLYKATQGNFTVTLRFNEGSMSEGIELTLMARESLDPSSNFVGLQLQKNRRHYRYHNRSAPNSDLETLKHNFRVLGSSWMRLERLNDTFRAYASNDGITWVLVGGYTQPLPQSMLVGAFLDTGSKDRLRAIDITFLEWRTDQDFDGLWDDEELTSGTSLFLSDTDGDGYSDEEEINQFYSDPLVVDLAPANEIQNIEGSLASVASGDWFVEDTHIYAKSGRGAVEYDITVDQDGIYRINLAGMSRYNKTQSKSYSVKVELDGVYIGRMHLDAEVDSESSAKMLSPWLNPGTYKIRLFVENTYLDRSLQINSLVVESIGGDDLDLDGVADWMTNRLVIQNGLKEFLSNEPITSLVSPYCLVGHSRYLGFSKVSYPEVEMQVLPEFGFFANIPLEQNSLTIPVIEFENSGYVTSADVLWVPTNMSSYDQLIIRTGDSLLLTAHSELIPTGNPINIILADGSILNTTDEQPVEVLFEESGIYNLTAQTSNGDEFLSVKVLEADLGDPISILVNQSRDWTPPSLSSEIIFNLDDAVILHELNSTGSAVREFALTATTTEPVVVAAQISEDGPYLDSLQLEAFDMAANADTRLRVIDTFEDGDTLIETSLILGDVPDDILIEVQIFVSGVTFLDGSIIKTFRAGDFDDTGSVKYYFIKPAETRTSVCNRIHVNFE